MDEGNREELSMRSKPPIHIKHGCLANGKREKLYNIWVSMKQRCYNPNDRNFFRYGGRGITVCDEWREDYIAFKTWCLQNGYKQGLDLDRRDNDDGYSPANCRFVTHRQNLANTHRQIREVIFGEEITLVEASDKYNLSYKLLYNRYKRGKRGGDLVAPIHN
jgi:hypothetical protein